MNMQSQQNPTPEQASRLLSLIVDRPWDDSVRLAAACIVHVGAPYPRLAADAVVTATRRALDRASMADIAVVRARPDLFLAALGRLTADGRSAPDPLWREAVAAVREAA